MSIHHASQTITQTVTKWPGITARPHRFGGTEYRIERREIGHIHGDTMVDIPFPTKVRHQIVADGRANPHHILPESGWVSVYIRQPEDVDRAIALLRKSYNLAIHQRRQKTNRQKTQ